MISMVSMINLKKWVVFFLQWLSFTVLCSLAASYVQAVTPPGLPQIEHAKDPFSIPVSLYHLRKEPLQKIQWSVARSGTEKVLLPLNEVQAIYGLSITADVQLFNEHSSTIKVILVDNQQQSEYLVYETYPYLTDGTAFSVQEVCEETCLLPHLINSFSLRIELEEAAITVHEIAYVDTLPPLMASELDVEQHSLKQLQEEAKIEKLNEKNLGWVAGETAVSVLSYEEKKTLFLEPEVPNLHGFEYYRGGVFEIKSDLLQASDETPSASPPAPASPPVLVENFSWTKRHGENWVTPVKSQAGCGACWAFSAVAVLETVTNLYFNQHLDLDLSEQDTISCSSGGSCRGGLPSPALDYANTLGVVDEACFSYSSTDQPCGNRCSYPTDLIKTSGRVTFGSPEYPKTEETLKKMLIEHGPMTGGIQTLRHGMELVGFEKDPSDGRTIWIFKNSWGKNWGGRLNSRWGDYHEDGYGDNGYAYIKLDMNNLGWSYAVQTPIISAKSYEIRCVDADNDQFCSWGIGPDKPSTCPESCKPQKDCDDSDSTLGPFDENYRCKVIKIPKKVKDFTVYNDGDGELVITSIVPEVESPWISISPSAFSVPPGGAQAVSVEVDYARISATEKPATRLLINSNDSDENPYPQGVDIVVESQPLPDADTTDADDTSQVTPLPTESTLPKIDTDGDGVADDEDAFPADPTQWQDTSTTIDQQHNNDKCMPLEELPCLGKAHAIDTQGQLLETASLFSGGAAVNGAVFQQVATLQLADEVNVRGIIKVDSSHVGKQADIVVYAGYVLPSNEQLFYMLDENIGIYQWDENVANLLPFKRVELQSSQPVDIYAGHFLFPGTLRIFFGYRLPEGIVVSNLQSIDVEVKE